MRSIKWESKYDNIVDLYCSKVHPASNASIFPTKRDFLCFCASLGFEKSLKKPVNSGSTSELDGRLIFDHSDTLDFIFLISLSEAQNVKILEEEPGEEIAKIFESYIGGGFEVLSSWLRDYDTDPYGDGAIIRGLQQLDLLGEDIEVGELPALF